MARIAGIRVTTIRVDFDTIIVANYSTAHVMQLCRAAKQRSELKGVAFDGLDSLFSHVASELQRNNNACECCGKGFERKAEGKGGGGPRSLSLHRVVASRGYTVANIKVICQSCNLAIGETNSLVDIDARRAALDWQAKKMNEGD